MSLPKAVVVLSGGMDSTTLMYDLHQEYDVHAISFLYGQKHHREIAYAIQTCLMTKIPHQVVDISNVGKLLSSALTNINQPIPEGHYTHETMKATVVPNRNAIMLSIAWGYAVSIKAEVVALAIHAGDHAIYPDCRPEFRKALTYAFDLGTEGFAHSLLHVSAPYINNSKADICKLGAALRVPFEHTWSCYKGGFLHCGKCGTCVERKEAFLLAHITDPTIYEDSHGS